jgi:DNA repair exonuclease SbcCD ATPase subunit
MRSDEADQRLADLHRAAEQVSASLVELEIDTGRQLLDASRLEGETARRWTESNAILVELWRRHSLLEAFLGQADELRGSKRAERLQSMVDGASIELAGTEVPLAQRTLLGSADQAQRCSPAELLAAMSEQFEAVKATLIEIDGVWDRLLPRLDEARGLLQEARRRAEELGEGEAELESVAQQLEDAGRTVSSDPLRAHGDEIDQASERLTAIRDELERTAELKRSFERSMLGAHEELERLRELLGEAAAARQELLVKIAAPDAPEAQASRTDLAFELNAITELARTGAWRQARRALDEFNARIVVALDQGRRARDDCRAPLRDRNQLRALLEAYQVKAKRLGRDGDPGLSEIFGEAHNVLYTAPTELARAAQLVRRYQLTLTQTQVVE